MTVLEGRGLTLPETVQGGDREPSSLTTHYSLSTVFHCSLLTIQLSGHHCLGVAEVARLSVVVLKNHLRFGKGYPALLA